jgi:uncharacterized protein (TIGR03437 family)
MKKMQMRRRAVLRHFASLIVCCATASAANLTLQLSNETAPPGGWAQIEVTLPAPALIGQGTLVVTLDPAVFGVVSAVATFSATGDAFGDATVSSGQVSASITSASASIGQLPGLPVLTFTIPVLSTAAIGTVSPVTATATNWTDAAGKAFTVTVGAGSVTIGGTLSVQNLSPGGGLMPAGTVVKINGTGFTASTVVTLAQVSIAKTQFVSAQEIDLTLASAAELTAKRLVLQNGDGEQAQFFSAMPSAPDRVPQGGSTTNHYMLSMQTFASAGQQFNIIGGGLIVLQNQNLTPVTVYLESINPVPFVPPPVTIPAQSMYVYSTVETGIADGLAAVSSEPIRSLAPSFGNPGYSVPGLPSWKMTPTQPLAQTPSASPATVSFVWQAGTAAPAAVTVSLSEGFPAAFTLVSTGAPFLVTPSQGALPGTIAVSVSPSGLGAGTYSGSIEVTPVGPNATMLTIPMTLTVTSSPYLLATPSSVVQYYSSLNSFQPGQPQSINVTSSGNSASFTASSNVPWMTVSPASGTAPGTISAGFSVTGLSIGTYNGQIVLTGPSNSVTIPVQLVIAPGENTIPAQSIYLSAQAGTSAIVSQSITGFYSSVSAATNTGGNWLTAVIQTSAGGSGILVSANPSGLQAGTYTGTLAVSEQGYLPTQWAVTLVVYTTLPPLTVTPPSLTFSGPADQLATQTLTVQSGGVPVYFTWSTSTGNPPVSTSVCSYLLESPCSGTLPLQTPATVQATAVPLQAIPPGFYSSDIAFAAQGQTVNVPVTIHVTPASGVPPYMGAIVNAASQASGAISPGEIITIFGYSVGPANTAGFAVDASGKVVTSLAGAQVLFDGAPAPLIYGSANQLNVMVPYEIANQASTVISLNYGGAVSTAWSVPVAASAPGIFTLAGDGVGPGAVLNQDGTVNSASNAAAQGSIVSVYATGEGQTSPAGVTGSVTGTSLKKPLLNVGVTIGGVPAVVQYAGSAPESIAGLLQVNAVVPQGIATGAVPVTISVGGLVSQAGVTMAVK